MKFFFALTVVALFAAASAGRFFTEQEVNAKFEQFKFDFGRSYGSPSEEARRRQIFADRIDRIYEHNLKFNAGLSTYLQGINNFTDLTNVEFRQIYNGYRGLRQAAPEHHTNQHVDSLPSTVDWTTKGVVTPIKNQAQCGSCWAFSAVASMEGQHALKTKQLVSLSEQNLVDCSTPQGDFGCEGGLMDDAFKYVISNKGIDTEASYSYKAIDENCAFKSNSIGATIVSYTDVTTGSETALQNAVATVGPISVAIDASNESFQSYASGVYDEPNCSSTSLDHGVTAVGYGTSNGIAYWKVKNSWGTVWGESGYILMSRNKKNQCGIATAASYPVV